MLDVMFEVPSRRDVTTCEITEETVRERIMPNLICEPPIELPVRHDPPEALPEARSA